MDHKKAYRFTKRTAGIAMAAALALTATGAAYAATDGGFAALWARFTVYINGEEATEQDYTVTTDENGNPQFAVAAEYDGENSVTVTVNPDAAPDPDTEYSISLDTDKVPVQSEAVPFTLEAENGRLYLVEADGNRLDVTEAAATKDGFCYTWTDKEGTEQSSIVLGTPEEHFITLSAGSASVNAIEK